MEQFNKIKKLLEEYPDTDELFDVLDVDLYDVVEHLIVNGLVVLPPWLEDMEDPNEEYED